MIIHFDVEQLIQIIKCAVESCFITARALSEVAQVVFPRRSLSKVKGERTWWKSLPVSSDVVSRNWDSC